MCGRRGGNSRASRADDRLSRLCTPSAVYAVRKPRPRSARARAPASALAVGVGRVPDLRFRGGGSGGRRQPRLYRTGLQVEEGVTADPVLVELVLPAGA